VNIIPNDKMESEDNQKVESTEKDTEEPRTKFFTEIKQSTRDLIDEIKKREGKTIGAIIDTAIQSYFNYKSMEPEVQVLIDKYIQKYGNAQKVIEEAIWILDEKENPEEAEDLELWCRAREELQMMLIGQISFRELLIAAEMPEESLDRVVKRNIALDLILWYTRKPIRKLTLREIINAIKKVWIVANYFHYIEVKKETEDHYHLIFKHHQDKGYSNYWYRCFKELFQSSDLSFKCSVEGEFFDETLSLTISKLYDLKQEELKAI